MATKRAKAVPALTEEHKAKMAEGRRQAQVFNAYFEAVRSMPSRRGRKITKSRYEELCHIAKDPNASAVQKADAILKLRQNNAEPDPAFELLEERFIEILPEFAVKKGYTKEILLQLGAPVSVLRKAGIR